MLRPSAFDKQVQVVDDRFEVGDQGTLAVRVPVPSVVEPIHGGAVLSEGGGDVVVAADVLPVAVHDDDEVARLRVRPRAHVQGTGVSLEGGGVRRRAHR